ncbi:MAG: phosphoadenosine phosphosulfate reductase family protein, partial [Chitinophagaceae bacterium]
MERLQALRDLFHQQSIADALHGVAALFPNRVKFSTSLGQEDQVLTDIIARNSINIHIFTIDTGRMFNETYETLERTEARYKRKIEVFFPQADAVQQMVNAHGMN